VIVADNQWAGGRAAAEHGLVEAIDGRRDLAVGALLEGCADLASDVERRRAMSAAGRALIDGRGPRRVVAAIEALIS
jgi:spore coat polysaccharide biosynthesis predicted glycosyltransferase SpsG